MHHTQSRFRKAFMTFMLMLLSMTIPIKAWADCTSCYWSGYQSGYGAACTQCAAVFQQLTALIQTSTTAINTNINLTRLSIEQAIKANTTATVAAMEKQSAANQQLKQAELNYTATSEAAKATADTADTFTAPYSDIMNPTTPANACATMATANAAVTAANNSSIAARALSAAGVRKNLYNSNAAGMMQKKIAEYKENFCSNKAAERGLCSTPVASTMQDADSNAGSLLSPAGGGTFSDAEAKAARSYIDNVEGPVSVESLPISLEKTPAGQRFVLEQRAMSAVRSMASFSLNSIFSANNPEDTGAGAQPESKLSMVGLMKKFVEERYGSPKWRADVGQLDTTGLLREVTQNMAFQNWMEYQSYLQAERTEGLLATQLALNVRDRSERNLGALRSQASAGAPR